MLRAGKTGKGGKKREQIPGLNKLWEDSGALPKYKRLGWCFHLLGRSWQGVRSAPVISIVSLLTIAVTLFLLGIFILFVENVGGALRHSQASLGLSIYLHDDAKEQDVQSLIEGLRGDDEIAEAIYRSKQEALEKFRQALGEYEGLLEGFHDNNPLPASIEIRPVEEANADLLFKRIAADFGILPQVERVYYDQGIAGQFADALQFFQSAGIVGVLCMLMVTAFIISNTIRLALYLHRAEIEIMRLMGTPPWLVRGPYIIEGVGQGFLGALLSLLLLNMFVALLRSSVTASPLLYAFFPHVYFLSLLGVSTVLAAGIFVGGVGSYLAVRRLLEI